MTMTLTNLKKARLEAVRFINKAEDAEKKIKMNTWNDQLKGSGSRETGAARRASLDLTLALADLRR